MQFPESFQEPFHHHYSLSARMSGKCDVLKTSVNARGGM
jgi:hypothetical protein